VVRNIIAICLKPKKYSEQHALINEWASDLFLYRINSLDTNACIEDVLPVESLEQLLDIFFYYIIGLLPFKYENKTVDATKAILNRGIYKWSSEDYRELKQKVVTKRFGSQWDSLDAEAKFVRQNEIQAKIDRAYHTMEASATASRFKNRQQQLDETVSTKSLKLKLGRVTLHFQHQYQRDLFGLYAGEFVELIPNSLQLFNDNFYEVGTYLHKYFRWSGD